MTTRDGKPVPGGANEGEGNRTAARAFDKAQQDFARSGRAEEQGRKAADALDGAQGPALTEAERVTRDHPAGKRGQ